MQKIWQEAEALQTELVERRRDLHRHPETGWTEFRTASIVIKELQALGYEVYMGDDALVISSAARTPAIAASCPVPATRSPLASR